MLNGYKTYIGIIGMLVASILSIDVQESEIQAIGLAVSAILAIYGRYSATKTK